MIYDIVDDAHNQHDNHPYPIPDEIHSVVPPKGIFRRYRMIIDNANSRMMAVISGETCRH
jgi:hypothetical protein